MDTMMSSNAEDYLIDDDISSEQLGGGMLAFVHESSCSLNVISDCDISSDKTTVEGPAERTNRPGPLSIRFDIMDAQIKHDDHGKFVVYTILVIQSAGYDKSPAKVDRRYSDFSSLHAGLRRTFPALMRDIEFPRKQLSGNFKPETIARRSRAFEQYLGHVFAIDLVRQSIELSNFFYGNDLQSGYVRIQNGDYSNAVAVLHPVWQLQSKLLGDSDPASIATLCAIVAAYHAMENDVAACTHAERALECIGSSHDRHLVPLLRLVIRLCWKLGRGKHHLEARLQELRMRGSPVDDIPSLLELVVNRFKR